MGNSEDSFRRKHHCTAQRQTDWFSTLTNYCIDSSLASQSTACPVLLIINTKSSIIKSWIGHWYTPVAEFTCVLRWINNHFFLYLWLMGSLDFPVPSLTRKEKQTWSIFFTFAVYSIQAPGRGTCKSIQTTQLKMKKKCKCKYEKSRHDAPLIRSESWLILIKNSITPTMVINYIKRFINREADKGFF